MSCHRFLGDPRFWNWNAGKRRRGADAKSQKTWRRAFSIGKKGHHTASTIIMLLQYQLLMYNMFFRPNFCIKLSTYRIYTSLQLYESVVLEIQRWLCYVLAFKRFLKTHKLLQKSLRRKRFRNMVNLKKEVDALIRKPEPIDVHQFRYKYSDIKQVMCKRNETF